MMLRVLMVLCALFAVGCSSVAPCGPANCGGCCDQNDFCRGGAEATACGVGGSACLGCDASQTCSDGLCRGQPKCGPNNCAGCCAADGSCLAGSTTAACGHSGVSCLSCSTGQICSATRVCDADPNQCNPSGPVVRTSQIQTVLLNHCVSCHYPPNGEGIAYADFTSALATQRLVGATSTYAGATGLLKVVDPRALANSSLWLKVSPATGALGRKGPHGEITGARMPNDGSALSQVELDQFKDWICSGAQP